MRAYLQRRTIDLSETAEETKSWTAKRFPIGSFFNDSAVHDFENKDGEQL